MKKSIVASFAIGALALAACGGVDREGSRDLFIEQIKESTGFDADADCVDAVLDEYSDDELEAFDDVSNDSPEAAEFGAKLVECVDLNSGG